MVKVKYFDYSHRVFIHFINNNLGSSSSTMENQKRWFTNWFERAYNPYSYLAKCIWKSWRLLMSSFCKKIDNIRLIQISVDLNWQKELKIESINNLRFSTLLFKLVLEEYRLFSSLVWCWSSEDSDGWDSWELESKWPRFNSKIIFKHQSQGSKQFLLLYRMLEVFFLLAYVRLGSFCYQLRALRKVQVLVCSS